MVPTQSSPRHIWERFTKDGLITKPRHTWPVNAGIPLTWITNFSRKGETRNRMREADLFADQGNACGKFVLRTIFTITKNRVAKLIELRPNLMFATCLRTDRQ